MNAHPRGETEEDDKGAVGSTFLNDEEREEREERRTLELLVAQQAEHACE